jgi:hypothetical protein
MSRESGGPDIYTFGVKMGVALPILLGLRCRSDRLKLMREAGDVSLQINS